MITEEEILRAQKIGAKIIGVNNRNLKDFTVDIKNSIRLREMVSSETIFVSESGIRGVEDMKALYRKLEDHATDYNKIDLHIAVSDELQNLGYMSLSEVFRDICNENEE